MVEFSPEMIIVFDPALCTQCMGCESACKSWREVPFGVKYRRVLNLWHGSYPTLKSSSLSLGCLHCVKPACAEVCPVEAIVKNAGNGLVEVDSELCTGCRGCAEACPYGVPQFGEDEIMVKCDLCVELAVADVKPPCVATCPGGALTLVSVDEADKLVHEKLTLELLRPESPA